MASSSPPLSFFPRTKQKKQQWLKEQYEIVEVTKDNSAAAAILKLTHCKGIDSPEKLRKAIADHVPVASGLPRKGQPHINAAMRSLLANGITPSQVAKEWVKLYRKSALKADYVLGEHDLLYVASLFETDIVIYSGKLEDEELPCTNIESYSKSDEAIHLWNDGDRYWALLPIKP